MSTVDALVVDVEEVEEIGRVASRPIARTAPRPVRDTPVFVDDGRRARRFRRVGRVIALSMTVWLALTAVALWDPGTEPGLHIRADQGVVHDPAVVTAPPTTAAVADRPDVPALIAVADRSSATDEAATDEAAPVEPAPAEAERTRSTGRALVGYR